MLYNIFSKSLAFYGLLLVATYGADLTNLKSSQDEIELPAIETLFISPPPNNPIVILDNTFIHPDDVYDFLLLSGVKKDAFIVDGDGTITEEEDPTKFVKDQKATLRGDSLNKMRTLIGNGNTLLICTAWTPFHEMIDRLKGVGFTEDDFKINGELAISKEQIIKVVIEGQPAPLCFMYNQYGRVFSVKHINIPSYGYSIDSTYHRAKALCLYIFTNGKIEFDNIHFLDDSSGNRRIFEDDVRALNLYPGIPIHIYGIRSIDAIQRKAQKTKPEH